MSNQGNRFIIPVIALCTLLILFWHHTALAPSSPLTGEDKGEGESKPQITTLLAVGDILLGRHIGTAIDKANNPNLPFEKTQELLSGADITFGNLECPFSDSNVPIREGIVFRCLTKYVPGLLYAGFDGLSTANNHAFDQGAKQIAFTRDFLLSQNILPVGAGRNQEEAWTPAIINRKNSPHLPSLIKEGEGEFQVAFLAASYASHNDGGKTRNDFVARIEDLDILKSKISNLKSENYFVIVSMHAGTEYMRHPNQEQINFARAAIDAGADVVIGHHPHWIQPIEIYKNRPIFYSLGNFVFDQSWSQETKEGLAVRLVISDPPAGEAGKRLEKAELIPVIIENNCCPRLATGEKKRKILKKINLETDTLNLTNLPP